jgi:hypothetical protein
MSFSHLPRALARSSAPSAHALRRPAYSLARVPLCSARKPVTLNRLSIRWASTSPARPRTWGQWFRGGVVRLTLAGGVVYFYCTSPVFELGGDRQGKTCLDCSLVVDNSN